MVRGAVYGPGLFISGAVGPRGPGEGLMKRFEPRRVNTLYEHAMRIRGKWRGTQTDERLSQTIRQNKQTTRRSADTEG